MSKKAKLYLLVVINLIAWGYVGYRIYMALQGDDDPDLNTENISIKKIEETKKEDSVILILNYPDPFLKTGNFKATKSIGATGNHTNNNKPQKTLPIPKTPAKPEPAPATLDIKYIGMVKNNDKGTQTAMLTINGKSYFVKAKDVIENLLIQEISSDFIKIKKGKELITINK